MKCQNNLYKNANPNEARSWSNPNAAKLEQQKVQKQMKMEMYMMQIIK